MIIMISSSRTKQLSGDKNEKSYLGNN